MIERTMRLVLLATVCALASLPALAADSPVLAEVRGSGERIKRKTSGPGFMTVPFTGNSADHPTASTLSTSRLATPSLSFAHRCEVTLNSSRIRLEH